jgi:TM2 domain-containing membrane protein YozV
MLNNNHKYCDKCGRNILTSSAYCSVCGSPQGAQFIATPLQQRNRDLRWLLTLLLCMSLGTLGIHNFFNGKITYGILQLLTLGGLGIWVLIDLIFIVTNNFKDAEGNTVSLR